ncbi:MAG TPA: hypothetical protein VFS34_09445, partial [Thermoanaerobaculia bacterium]|nr:hypothetical protein [Thermoanaerobaculia bacterium]
MKSLARVFSVPIFSLASLAAAQDRPPSMAVPRARGIITIDGSLGDPGWEGAAVIDRFWETQPGDNAEPPVKT